MSRLPGKAAHQEMYPSGRTVADHDLSTIQYRSSAVLVLLFERRGTIQTVLIQRQHNQGKHSGQIGFPGGKVEQMDRDTQQTALRETEEEIGVRRESVTVLGKLTDVYIPISNFLVHPYVGYLSGMPRFVPSEAEVQAVIPFDIRELLMARTRQVSNVKTPEGLVIKNTPCFFLHGRTVWGATALILNELKHLLLPFKSEV